MSRKYRQRGYQDSDRRDERSEKREPPPPSEKGKPPDRPRSPVMPGFHEVFRCSMCGASMDRSYLDVGFDSHCPKCSADLHCCKQCVYFDPSSRFECTELVPVRILPKDKRNECELFEPRTRIEKETTTPSSERPKPSDGRDAFERLFKK
ncbi:MAG: hypothetical protein ACR2L2_00490 [Acidobacteriota bacterium]